MIAYLDSSAAMKLLIEEAESDAFREYWRETTAAADLDVTAGWLLHTELHCAARRRSGLIDPGLIARTLESVNLVDVVRADFRAAASIPKALRSNDAIHLAVAQRINADTLIAYDGELLAAAEAVGLRTVTPG